MARIGWGDECIVTGQVRELYDRDPRRVRIVYERPRWHAAFDYNPKIASPGEEGNLQDLRPRVHGLRPYCTSKTPERWTWKAYRPPRGELFFNKDEERFRNENLGRVIFEAGLKINASPNKDWGWSNWGALNGMAERAGIKVTQLGEARPQMLHGAEYLQTRTMRIAAAVIAGAKVVVTHEGATHHVAAAFGVPTIVLFGGYISPAVTGYDDQVNLFSGGDLGCGARTTCSHCRKAMNAIAPELVFEKLNGLLNGNLRRVP